VILVLTSADDELQKHVLPALSAAGARFVRFNTEEYPERASLSLTYSAGARPNGLLAAGSSEIDLDEITTVWHRRPRRPVPRTTLSHDEQVFVRNEASHMIAGLYHLLEDRFWVNPYVAGQTAESKPFQLAVAKELGFDVPRTLITNKPEDALRFFDACKGEVVYKTMNMFGRLEQNDLFGIFTTRVDRAHLVEHAADISLAPCLYQERVPKRDELRVTVMGDEVFAIAIDSQQNQITADDWRRGALIDPAPYSPCEIPGNLVQALHRFLARLGLVFGCFDIIRTPDDRFVFLELNANGEWYWCERATGLPMLAAFTRLLTTGGHATCC
jgi:glutathione synthase/RimK-type ligase-like ATP-grasp enzyme